MSKTNRTLLDQIAHKLTGLNASQCCYRTGGYGGEGRAVQVFPNKGLVRIDGFRLFKMTDEAIRASKENAS